MLLLVFAVFSALQQGAYVESRAYAGEASSAAGHIHQAASQAFEPVEDHHLGVGHASDMHSSVASDDNGSSDSACEVHCAPCPAMTTQWQFFPAARARCYAVAVTNALVTSDSTGPQRPPQA